MKNYILYFSGAFLSERFTPNTSVAHELVKKISKNIISGKRYEWRFGE